MSKCSLNTKQNTSYTIYISTLHIKVKQQKRTICQTNHNWGKTSEKKIIHTQIKNLFKHIGINKWMNEGKNTKEKLKWKIKIKK